LNVLIYAGAAIIIVWGIAHIVPVGSVVRGFGPISADNKRIITMEWLAEGLTLIFIGVLALRAASRAGYDGEGVARWVIVLSAVMLLIMAILTRLTGARTKILAMKICPWVKTLAAVMFLVFITGTAG
jgi:hypothetical protein